MKYMLIQEHGNHDDHLSVSQKTALLIIQRSGYYKWLQKPTPVSNAVRDDMKIRDELQQIALEFPRYG